MPGPLDDPAPLARIPFYPDEPRTWFPRGADAREPLPADSGCRRCTLSRATQTVCMASAGPASGAPLVVLGTPTQRDDVAGQLVESGAPEMILHEVRRHLPGGARVTWAVRCAAGRLPTDAQVDACRGYLAGELDPVRVPRALLVGDLAAYAATGHDLRLRSLRRARAVVRGVPCFMMLDPGQTARNRFLRRQLQADVAWGLGAPAFGRPDGAVEVLLEEARAVAWLEAATRDPISVDAEWSPKSVWTRGEFRLLSLGLCQDPAAPVVIPEEVLKLPAVVRALKRVLEDEAFPKVNQSIKADVHALWRALRIDLRGIEADTLIWSRLRDSEAPADLFTTAWQAGYGGYKEIGQVGASEEDE